VGRGDNWPSDGKRDAERGWNRDDKGRLYREEAGSRLFRDQGDRDQALEEIYTTRPCESSCCRSILASVDCHRDMLIAEYMSWCQSRAVREAHDSESLAQWERERFGARLYIAAHGVLLHAVAVARFGLRRPSPKQPRLKDGLTDEERFRSMMVAVKANAEGRTMPDRMSGQEWDARRREQYAGAMRQTGEEG
jgi:hypothetical protein